MTTAITAIPVLISTEVTVVREDEWGEEHTLTVSVRGAVSADDDTIDVQLMTAVDDVGGKFIAHPDDLNWGEAAWCEDSLAAAWEDLHGLQ